MNLKSKVFALVEEIPEGKVTTYKEIARVLNTSARAIGSILSQNENIPEVPCHRVVKSNGKLGGYKLGRERKEELLKQEGVKVVKGKIDLEEYFHEFGDEK